MRGPVRRCESVIASGVALVAAPACAGRTRYRIRGFSRTSATPIMASAGELDIRGAATSFPAAAGGGTGSFRVVASRGPHMRTGPGPEGAGEEAAMGRAQLLWSAVALSLTLASCSGGSNTSSTAGTSPPPPTQSNGCDGSCATASSFLSEDDVRKIIAQAANEAAAINSPATIVVTDRVGNVLAAYRMTGAPR